MRFVDRFIVLQETPKLFAAPRTDILFSRTSRAARLTTSASFPRFVLGFQFLTMIILLN